MTTAPPTKPNGTTNGDHTKSNSLPSFTEVQQSFLVKADPRAVSEDWLRRFDGFAKDAAAGDVSGADKIFLEGGWWRDRAALTWDNRTFHGLEAITKAVSATFPSSTPGALSLASPSPEVNQPYPDIGFIQAHFSFSTKVGVCTGVVNLLPSTEGVFRAWTLSTVLEGLREFPELERPNGRLDGVSTWAETRARNAAFVDEEPDVVIVGAGHNGLVLAARLQQLGVKVLCVELNSKPGDFWRQRYEALSLHFPVWQDHLPFMEFPKQWPIYTPAAKIGNFLDAYADCLDLNVWTNSKVTGAKWDQSTKRWTVSIERKGLGMKELKPRHFVVATGLAGVPNVPDIPGMDSFEGKIVHSSAHDSAKYWKGKKILVVGTSSSAFDAALDAARYGVEVTMLQRNATYVMSLTHGAPAVLGHIYSEGGPPMDVADRIAQSMPTFAGEELARRMTAGIAEKDKEMIDGLKKAGFEWYDGIRGTGTVLLGWERGGGFYYDCGATKAVIDGRIKIQQGTIAKFEGDKVVFADGTFDHYDLVILATGYGSANESLKTLLGDDVGSQLKNVWGLDAEGELTGAWRFLGVRNLWAMVGTFGWARFHSKIVAARIKADLEGIAGEMYLD
ncbi:hypothetical protein RQP46_006171 [Phenoliferia psychrophenolica]